MRWLSRGTRRALLAYALLAILILGGVTWGTLVTLSLERTEFVREHLQEHNHKINQALYRIKSKIEPILAAEWVRRPWEYSSYWHPPQAWDAEGNEVEVVEPSPIMGESSVPYIRLYFQVSPKNEWESPQVPTSTDRLAFAPNATIPAYDEAVAAEKHELLESLQMKCTSYDVLAARVESANTAGLDESPASPLEIEGAASSPRFATVPETNSLAAEFNRRQDHFRRAQRLTLEKDWCTLTDPFGGRWVYGAAADPGNLILGDLELSSLTAIWLGCDDAQHRQLAFVRTARVEGSKPMFQGFLMDWEMLKTDLLVEIRDLLPTADLIAVNPTDKDVQQSQRLSTIPAAIVTGPMSLPDIPWTSKRWLLVGVWVAALATLAGVGIGVESLLALTERRTQFAYGVTHELRTPLTTLRLYTDMLASGLVPDKDRDGYCRTLRAEAERLSDLVNGVLEYARVENRAVRLDIAELSLSELLDSIHTQCASQCDGADKKLVIDVNGCAGETLRTDANLVRQVITNLVDNACKYTQGAADPTITVRAGKLRNGRIALDVEDRGPGIRTQDRQWVFRPFRRGTNGSQRPGGIGLGLALARSWAGLLGGHLELVAPNSPDKGTCFRLTIPQTIRKA